ncbi:transcriptional regulator [Kitasatospora indigofera]|uniref:transcriptional regulator n=1 Tax=Kitasatospora indigofera TaxID=67307 RepID=UPI0036894B9C
MSKLSKNGLGRAVTALAAERGCAQINPDGSRVRRWLEGEQPRDPVPELIAAVLTDKCGIQLSADDLGLRPSSALPDPTYYLQPATILDTLARSAQTTLAAGPVHEPAEYDDQAQPPSVPARLLPALESWSWTKPRTPLASRSGLRTIGPSDAVRIAEQTSELRRMDNKRGGATMAFMALAHLATTTQLIRDGSYTEETGRLLFRELADIAGVVGWAAHDAAAFSTATRYLTLAVQAARESGDRDLTAHLLQALARVWGYVNHFQLARDCIALAVYGARNTASPVVRSGLHALDGRFAALLGDQQGALRSVNHAQDIFAEDRTGPTPAYVAYFDAAELSSTLGEVLLFLSRRTGIAQHAHDAVSLLTTVSADRDEHRVRSRAFDAIALARALVFTGAIDEAGASTQRALAAAQSVDSARVRRRLRDLARETSSLMEVPIFRQLHAVACASRKETG